jgi:bla regulator protein BlaR1
MITYLVNSTLCSGLLLAIYYLLLKNKAMYNFNRYYLLASIFFSLTVPLIVIQSGVTPLPSILPVQSQIISQGNFISGNPANEQLVVTATINYWWYGALIIYGAVTLLLVFRLLRNLYTIRLTRLRNEKVNYRGVQLVLIYERLTPHTFLNYIFLNKEDYDQHLVEDAVLHHELAHARQWHSADIILTELIQAFYWFNPFLILYRKAIRVNHEFIADMAALNNGNDLSVYQNLLIGKAAQLHSLSVTSQFNYSITKKRLIMMTKTTSLLTAWCIRLALIPVLGIAFILFCNKTEAQQPAAPQQPVSKHAVDKTYPKLVGKGKLLFNPLRRAYPSTKEGASDSLMNEYIALENKYGKRRLDFSKTITKPEEKRMEWIYQHMSMAQQKDRAIFFMYPPEPRVGSVISRTDLNSWKDPSVYGVWLDGKRIKNSELKRHSPEDFNEMFFSRLTDKAVKNDGFHYQIELMTRDYYKRYREQAIANRNNSMIVFHLKS